MIVNRNTIKRNILAETLQDQINRLKTVLKSQFFHKLRQIIVFHERSINVLHHDYSIKNEEINRIKVNRECIFNQLYLKRVGLDMQKQTCLAENKQLITQLQSARLKLRESQDKIANQKKNNTQLDQNVDHKEKKNERKQKQKADIYDQLKIFYKKIIEFKESVTLATQKNKDTQREIQILKINLQKNAKENAQEFEKYSNLKIINQNMIKTANLQQQLFINEQKTCYLELQNLIRQSQSKKYSLSLLQSEIFANETKIKDSLLTQNLTNEIYAQKQNKIVQNMKISEQISSLVFEAKVKYSTLKIKNEQKQAKILGLKRLKNILLQSLTEQ